MNKVKQTFVTDILYDSQYKILCDYVGKPDCECSLDVPLPIDQNAEIGDTVYFRCLHYWYKGIVAKSFINQIVESNVVEVRFSAIINPKRHSILSLSELEEILPNKGWNDRHAHILLDTDEAQLLNSRWDLLIGKQY